MGVFSMAYNEQLCEERHRQIDTTLLEHDKTLEEYDKRLRRVENESSANDIEVKNLVKAVNSLVSTLKWGIGLLVPTMLTVIGLVISTLSK